jgi:hypothetical protein
LTVATSLRMNLTIDETVTMYDKSPSRRHLNLFRVARKTSG